MCCTYLKEFYTKHDPLREGWQPPNYSQAKINAIFFSLFVFLALAGGSFLIRSFIMELKNPPIGNDVAFQFSKNTGAGKFIFTVGSNGGNLGCILEKVESRIFPCDFGIAFFLSEHLYSQSHAILLCLSSLFRFEIALIYQGNAVYGEGEPGYFIDICQVLDLFFAFIY